MSVDQLALKLEKSEAGRRKLRQAISILQEKLDATEKVLQINEALRKECEQERQRAEDEKKKADEEKKLRCMLEKDSVVVKDQLAKVLLRLGAVEAKQKLDKKEADRVRDEVKITVEGVHVASKAVNAMQSSLESLEIGILEKVRAAYEKSFSAFQDATMEKVQSSIENAEATIIEKVNAALEKSNAASQVANAVQISLKNLENTLVKKVSSCNLTKFKHTTEGMVDNIAQLFVKERKSHLKIEHGLATLKDLLKEGRSDELVSTSSAALSSDEWAPKNRKRSGKSGFETLTQHVHVPDVKARKRKRNPDASDVEDRALQKKRKQGRMCCKAESITKGSGSANEERGLERSVNLLESMEAAYASNVSTDDLELDMDVDFVEGELENDKWFKGKTLLSPNLPYLSSPIRPLSPLLSADIVLPVEVSEGQHQIVLAGGTEDAATLCGNNFGAGFDEGKVMDVGNGMHITRQQSCAEVLQSQAAPMAHSSEVDSLHAEQQEEEVYADYEHAIKLDGNRTVEICDGLVSSDREVLAAGGASIGAASFRGSEFGVCNYVDMAEGGGHLQSCEKFEVETFENTDIDDMTKFLEALPVIISADQDASNLPCSEQYLASSKLDYPENCEPNLRDKSSTDSARVPTNSNLGLHALSQSLISECHSQVRNEVHSSVTDNIQLVNGSVHLKEKSSAVFFLQGLDFDEEDQKKNVIVVGMVALAVRNYLLAEGVGKNDCYVLKSLIATDVIVQVQFWSLGCSFISSLVDVARLDTKGEHSTSKHTTLNSLVQSFVHLIRTVFDEKSSSVLDSIFAQLGRFLIEGNTTIMTLHGIEQEALVSAKVLLEGQVSMAYCRSKATLKDICAGSKVLAALCQVLSCVSHLQNVVYELLGWCDKDAIWLLTVFSSFASICGHMSFIMGEDDLLGYAICAIIRELLENVDEQGDVRENWEVLKSSIDAQGSFAVNSVLASLLSAFWHLLTHDSLFSRLRACQDSPSPCAIKANGAREDAKLPETSERAEGRILLKTGDINMKVSNIESWKRKYTEVVGGLELIAICMGWQWTYNDLIVKHLWRMVESGCVQVVVAAICHLVGTLARVALESRDEQLPGFEDLKRRLFSVLHCSPVPDQLAPHFHAFAQEAAAYALWDLRSLARHTNGGEDIKDWFHLVSDEKKRAVLEQFQDSAICTTVYELPKDM